MAFAESFMEGRWDTPDLTQLLTVLAANQSALENAFYGRWWTRSLLRLKHFLNANTKRQAKRNIVAHYDLGNAFYRLWLDDDDDVLVGAVRRDGLDAPLGTGATREVRRILDELALATSVAHPGDRLRLGRLCRDRGARRAPRDRHLAVRRADRVCARAPRRAPASRLAWICACKTTARPATDTTASPRSRCSRRWASATGRLYFETVRRALKPGGRACIQTITIADDRFERYRTQSDFIQQYIFPGGMLASPVRFADVAAAAGLRLERVHSFGRDYAETLKRWLAAFDAAVPAIRAQGFDEHFIRCWRFYLAYCAAGFDTGTTDVAQYTFARA